MMTIYRPEIDGLRALAVVPVILFHAGFELFRGGFVGVDVFFVISGYLISLIIASEIDADRFSLLEFYERRARRLLPALFFVLSICTIFAVILLGPDDLKDFGQSLVAVSFFNSNFLFWLESDYFDTAAELKPLLHTWSLAVEEQFYIIYPLVLIGIWKFNFKIILGILFTLSVISFSLAVLSTSIYNDPGLASSAFFLLPARAWELLLGAFCAFYLRRFGFSTSRQWNQILSFLGFCMILLPAFLFNEKIPFPGFYGLLPTLGTCLIILFAIPSTTIGNLLSFGPLVSVGLISYSAYLWHQPLFAFVRHRFLFDLSDFMLLGLSVFSLVLGYLSWRYVEKPFRNRALFSRKLIFFFSGIGIMIFACIGLYLNNNSLKVVKTNPNFDTEIYLALTQAEFKRRSEIKEGECQFNGRGANRNIDIFIKKWDCRPVNKPGKAILVFGDSIAADIANSLRSVHENTIQLTGAGCGLIPVDQSDDCKKIFYKMQAEITNGVDAIVLGNSWTDDELTDEYLQKVKSYWLVYGIPVNVVPPPLTFSQFQAAFMSFNTDSLQNNYSEEKFPLGVFTKPESGWQVLLPYSDFCREYKTDDTSQFCEQFFNHYLVNRKEFLRTDAIHLTEFGASLLSIYLKKLIIDDK